MKKQDKLNEHQEGIYYDPATTGDHAFLKLSKPDKEKNHPNVCVLGDSGSGRGFRHKDIALMECAKGTRIILIDPMSEYQHFCQNLEGDFINGDGEEYYLNNSERHLSPEKAVPGWK